MYQFTSFFMHKNENKQKTTNKVNYSLMCMTLKMSASIRGEI